MALHALIARNTASESSNLIHSDDVARSYGFRGGLVPGVTDYAYLTRPVVERWGRRWLNSGTARTRFLKPVYDGDRIEIALGAGGELELRSRGEVCATGSAELPPESTPIPQVPRAQMPAERPAATRAAFESRPVLGSIVTEITPELASAYLAKIEESLPIYSAENLVHPGLLLSQANEILIANCVLPPWVHVESEVKNLAAVAVGDTIETRARVSRLEERKGHRFVELEVLIVSADRGPASFIRHLSIYQLRAD